MTISAPELLDDLYEQFTALSNRAGDGRSSSAFVHGRRAALAHARLFVLDQQAAESTAMM